MDERSTIWVVSTREWYETWLSGQTRHERSPGIRHIDTIDDTYGIVILPSDRVIYGDTERMDTFARRDILERIVLAKLVGLKLADEAA